jgi:hypothetical protein
MYSLSPASYTRFRSIQIGQSIESVDLFDTQLAERLGFSIGHQP